MTAEIDWFDALVRVASYMDKHCECEYWKALTKSEDDAVRAAQSAAKSTES